MVKALTIDASKSGSFLLGGKQKLQKEGKIRYIGLSELSVAEIEQARKIVNIVSVQNEYNISNRKSESVLKYCEKEGLGFIPWAPIGSGDLTHPDSPLNTIAKSKDATPAQIALAWLLKRSPVMLPIPGTSSIPHLEENTAAASIHLSDKEMALLDSIG